MTRQFDRKWFTQVDGLDLSEVDVSFKIERSTARAPGTAEIRLWNLAPTTRAAVEAGQVIILRAGYEDPPRLFRGDIRGAYSERVGLTDRVTVVSARDGGHAYSTARISRSYAPGTRVATVLRDVVADLDIGEGNLGDFLSGFAFTNSAQTFPDGFVAAGPARRVLDGLLRGAGLRWSVQSGALQIQDRGGAISGRSVLLASDSGLLESPAWDETGRRTSGRRGFVTAKSLIQADLEPGRAVRVESEAVTGDFEIRSVTFTGDTRGNDWAADMKLRPSQ